MFTDRSKQSILNYKIHSTSTSAPNFNPNVVYTDDPTNASSRWTSTANDLKQHMTLKLDDECIVTRITFGKFHKMHVCNLKHFKIYSYNDCTEYPIANTEKKPLQILKNGLKNDATPETFAVKFIQKNTFIISNYIKIQPIQAWGVNFNFSIWHIKIHGINKKDLINQCILFNTEVLNRECYKSILRFLKQQNKHKSFQCVQDEVKETFEPEIKKQMRRLIEDENYIEPEELMEDALKKGLIDKQKFSVAE